MTDETVNPEVTTPETAPVYPTPAPEKKTSRQMSFTVQEDGTIRADFGAGIDPLTLRPLDVPETLQAAAMTEGLISRARGYTSRLEGDARTPAALREAIAKAFANLKAGVWKIEREAGEAEYTVEVEAAFLFRAMRAKAKGEEYAEVIADVAEAFTKLDDEQKKKLKALPRYQLALAEVKAKRAQEKQAALLAKLDKEGDDAGF